MRLSVIVPAYNEAKSLWENVNKFNDYLRVQDFDYEIIIVNDGSRDETGRIAADLARENSKIRLLDNEINRGKGAAVRQGILAANGDFRLFIDADNATAVDHLDKVWPLFAVGRDIVIGSRNSRDAVSTKIMVGQPFWKIILGKAGNFFIRGLAVKGIRDTQCGFKVFTKEAALDIFSRTRVSRWAIDVEILALAQSKNLKIGIIPVHWKNSGKSRVGIGGYLSTLVEVLKIKFGFITKKYSSKNVRK